MGPDRTFILTVLVRALFAALIFVAPTRGRAESLEFQPTNSQFHVAIQPRADYHRVHIVVRADGLMGQPCVARVTCSIENREVEDSRVNFTPTMNIQSCAIYVRTTKIPTQTATYVLQVAPSDGLGPDLGRKSALIYHWTVERDASGTASFKYPKGGDSFTAVLPVFRQISETIGGETKFRIVWETRMKQVQVPAGFTFGVDENDSTEVFDPVLLFGG
jgi:hypothetical protein